MSEKDPGKKTPEKASAADVAKRKAKVNASRTLPQFSENLKILLFLDRVMKSRNDEFEKRLGEHIAEHQKRQRGLTAKEISGLEATFTQTYYKPEFDAIAEHAQLKSEYDTLKGHEDKGDPLTQAAQKRLNELKMVADMTPEQFVGYKYIQKDTHKQMKKAFPKELKALEADIRSLKSEFKGVSDVQQRKMATVKLFNNTFPNLPNELDAMQVNGKPKVAEAAKYAKGLLKVASLANPSGLAVSMAVGAIMSTKTFQSVSKEAARGISNLSEKAGLTSVLKKGLSKMNSSSVGRISMGVAAGTVGLMVAVGVVGVEDAAEMAMNIQSGIMNFAMDASGATMELANNALDSGVEFFDESMVMAENLANGTEEMAKQAWDGAQDFFDDAVSGPDVAMADSSPALDNSSITSAESDLMGDAKPAVEEDVAPSLDASSFLDNAEDASPDIKDGGHQVDQSVDEKLNNSMNMEDAFDPAEENEQKLAMQSADAGGSPTANDPTAGANEKSVKDVMEENQIAAGEVEPAPSTLPKVDYIVQPGDTLSEIVEARLREAGVPYNYDLIDQYVDGIVADNDSITDKNVIRSGMTIELPALPNVEQTFNAAPPGEMRDACQRALAFDAEMYTPRVIEASFNSQTMDAYDMENMMNLSDCVAPVPETPDYDYRTKLQRA
tara:strand:- start:43318 stop:45321 length:2004 start_codon:yes stop_codon:yes gene_type:complete